MHLTGKLKTGIATCAVLLLLAGGALLAQAQVQDRRWSVPLRLSSEQGSFAAESNVMVADPYGFLHVFWVEEDLPDKRSIIQYTRFDGETWTPPLDIYATGPGGSIGPLAATVDKEGRLNLVWAGPFRQGPLYYMYAPAHNALSAKQWSRPERIDVPAYWVGLQIDAQDVMHILYAKFNEPNPGIYYLRSENLGQTWSDPLWLDPEIPYNQAPAGLQFALDEAGGLHAVWHYMRVEDGIGQGVYYAHSLDRGQTWSLPVAIDEPDGEDSRELRLAVPGLVVQGQNIHVIWAGTERTNREHRFSTDAGQNWSVPVRVFGNLEGQAQGDGLAVDAAGRVHFAGQIRYPQGIYHAYWDRDHWADLTLFYQIQVGAFGPENGSIHAHSVRLAVRAGNQLVTTFYDRSSRTEPFVLYAMTRVLDDITPSPPLPTPEAPPPATPAPPTESSPAAAPSPSTPAPTLSPRPTFDAGVDSLTSNGLGAGSAIWLGLVPAVLLVGAVMAIQLFRRR